MPRILTAPCTDSSGAPSYPPSPGPCAPLVGPEEEDITEVAVEAVGGGSKRRRGQRKEQTVVRSLGTLVGSTGSVNAVCWPDEGTIYSSGEDHCLRTWDVASSKNISTLVRAATAPLIPVVRPTQALFARTLR